MQETKINDFKEINAVSKKSDDPAQKHKLFNFVDKPETLPEMQGPKASTYVSLSLVHKPEMKVEKRVDFLNPEDNTAMRTKPNPGDTTAMGTKPNPRDTTATGTKLNPGDTTSTGAKPNPGNIISTKTKPNPGDISSMGTKSNYNKSVRQFEPEDQQISVNKLNTKSKRSGLIWKVYHEEKSSLEGLINLNQTVER